MTFLVQIAGVTLLYALWGMSLGILVRRLNLLCLAGAAIAATGAYAFALCASWAGASLAWLIAPIAGAAAGAIVIGAASRVRGHDYALATFGVMLAWESFVAAAEPLTGGAFGLTGVPPLPFASSLGNGGALLLLAGLLAVVAASAMAWEKGRRLPVAAAITARSSELARSLGVDGSLVVLLYGSVVGAFVGLAGAVTASYIGFVGPTLLTVSTAVTMLALALSWGNGHSRFLAVLMVLIAAPELLRFLDVRGLDVANLRIALAGGALALLGLTARLPGERAC